MIELTIPIILKILPFDAEVRAELLEKMETMDPDRRFYFERLLWEAYDALYELKLQENTQKAFLRAKQNREKLDKDFYARIEEQTEKEMMDETLESSEKADLEDVRKAMEVIVKEIHASKKQKN